MDSKKEIEPGMVFKNREGEEYEVVREYATNNGLPHFLIRFRNPESWQVVPKRSIGRLMLSNKAKKFVYGVDRGEWRKASVAAFWMTTYY